MTLSTDLKFYEEQQPGLGTYFPRLFVCRYRLVLRIHGGVHRVVYRNYHRALSKPFPFAIFYTVSGETIFVHAVVDCQRRPEWIKEHLK